jgi:2-methylcitrate dehydratase PrpD
MNKILDRNLTEEFIKDLLLIKSGRIDASITHKAKRTIVDYIGVSFAGAKLLKNQGKKLEPWINQLSTGYSVVGFGKGKSIESAAFANGLISHMAELDDGVNSGIVHPGAPILSALLPLAEMLGSPKAKIIKAIVIGYETVIRLADAIQPAHKKLGYHATGTCGTIGAAIASGLLLNLDNQQLKHAFSAAAVSASGLLKAIDDGSELKPYNLAMAAMNGLISAFMAREGFQGPDDVLSGERGFLRIMSADNYNLDSLKFNPEDKLGVERTYMKPYAACRYCHPSIEAAITLKKEIDIPFGEVKEILVETYDLAVHKHDHTDIHGIGSAKMSIPYSVAVALYRGKAGISEFTEELSQNSELKKITQLVRVVPDEDMSLQFPLKSPARVTLRMTNGSEYVEYTEYPIGEPENPLTDEQLSQKFLGLMDFASIDSEKARDILYLLIHENDQFSKLYSLI